MLNRRRTLKVKDKFQDRMILEVVLVTFVFINMLVISGLVTMETMQDLLNLKVTLAVALTVGELSGLGFIYYFSLKASHRIAGPVFMIERRLSEIANGDLTVQLKLRKEDHFQETSDELNNCVNSLREKISAIKAAATDVQLELDDKEDKAMGLVGELMDLIDEFKINDATSAAEDTYEEDVADAEWIGSSADLAESKT